MRTIDDSSVKLHKLSQVAKELDITPATIIRLAAKTNSSALLYIPDNTDIYLVGETMRRLSTSFAEGMKNFRSGDDDDDKPLKVDHGIKFLELNPSSYELIIQKGELRENAFPAVATFTADAEITHLKPNDYSKYHLKEKSRRLYLLDFAFRTVHRDNDNKSDLKFSSKYIKKHIEDNIKTITVKFEDLHIDCEDLKKIRNELSIQEPDYGNFKKGEWTSKMLSILNEASTNFFSKGNVDTKDTKKLLEIEEWLRFRWEIAESRKIGADVLNEAAKSILPDASPCSQSINSLKISKYTTANKNEYTSTLLAMINELALHYWKESKSNDNRYKSAKEITYELGVNYKLTGRITKAIPTIIRLK